MELTLPPPARLDAGTAEGALPRSTQKALGRLFSACGLSADFSGGVPVKWMHITFDILGYCNSFIHNILGCHICWPSNLPGMA